jgi:glycosyltransferase involved in cell wall biosynthesis
MMRADSKLPAHLPYTAAVSSAEYELTVVMPCLNEAETLRPCITKALRAFESSGIAAEIIVADNGSTDGSQALAAALGARVLSVSERGYGSALMGGIEAARGRFIIMGDADDSYDFGEIPKFVAKLRQGYELVQGCRLPSGGGIVAPGAMPPLHRWWGNPMFSWMARRWFGAPIHDVYCGMRGFTREFYDSLDQRCTGMEFATEMMIKSSLRNARIAEVPITLHPDGRTVHPPHLKTFRDGWRTLRFFLLYSPRWLFFYPGLALALVGLVGYGVAIPGVRLGRITFDVHTLVFASLAILAGYQAVLFAVFAKMFAFSEGLLPMHPPTLVMFRRINLERGLAVGASMILAGTFLLLAVVYQWYAQDFGGLDYPRTLRWAIPGFTLTSIGLQTIFGSFFISILGLRRR